MMDHDYLEFIKSIHRFLGIDLSLYKESQMKRRLHSFIEKKGYSTFNNFFSDLKRDQVLVDEFLDRITINVSEFFRNAHRWEILDKQIIPELLKNKRGKLRCWSAACSTGEEPYTLSIILQKHLSPNDFEIIATDIDTTVLSKAKEGIYSTFSLKECPKDVLKNYFKEQDGLFHLSDSVKKTVSFKKHDLLQETFPADLDLIICRNVLIYFTDEAKNQLYYNFSKSLKKDGVLFVGSTEQIFEPNKFDLKINDSFFYIKKI
jgi:chemotaxis protein methyltransferase CheR